MGARDEVRAQGVRPRRRVRGCGVGVRPCCCPAWGRKRLWAGRGGARLGRSESPRARRARGRCWRDSDSQTGMGASTLGKLTHRTLGRARARSAACVVSRPQLRSRWAFVGRGGLRRASWVLRPARPTYRRARPTLPGRRQTGWSGAIRSPCLSCDSCLLESGSAPRGASAGRSWPWPGYYRRRRSGPSRGSDDSC